MGWTEQQQTSTSWTAQGSLAPLFSEMVGVGSRSWGAGLAARGPFGHGSFGHTYFGHEHGFAERSGVTTAWEQV